VKLFQEQFSEVDSLYIHQQFPAGIPAVWTYNAPQTTIYQKKNIIWTHLPISRLLDLMSSLCHYFWHILFYYVQMNDENDDDNNNFLCPPFDLRGKSSVRH